MNIGHDNNKPGTPGARDFDATLRQVHAQAVEHVPMRTLTQLRPQRQASRDTSKPGLFAWPLAATCAIALVATGLFLRHPDRNADPADTASPTIVATEEPGDVYAALDESPDLYVWLASTDTTNLVME